MQNRFWARPCSAGALSCLFLAAAFGQSSSFQPFRIPLSGTPQSVTAGDFNGDGFPDLAVAITDSSGSWFIEMLLGNGDGTFHSLVLTPVAGPVRKVIQADFNRDGQLDLAVLTTSLSGQTFVFLGNGDGRQD